MLNRILVPFLFVLLVCSAVAACGGQAAPQESGGASSSGAAAGSAGGSGPAAPAAGESSASSPGGAGSSGGEHAALPGEPVSIPFGIVAKNATDWPLYVGIDKGFFVQHGVALDLIATGSSANTSQQMAAGSLAMGESGLVDFIRAIEGGAPMKIIASGVGSPPYELLAQPDIERFADLKGKTIIIGGAKDVTRIFLEAMLEANGLKDGDYDLVYAGSTNNRYAALKSGSVAAALLFPPFDFRAEAEGYRNLGSVQQYLPDFPFTGYAVDTRWAAGHESAVAHFLTAYLASVDWLYDTANKEEAIAILAKESNTQQADAEKTYELLFEKLKVYRKDGALVEDGLQQVIDALVRFGDLPSPPPPPSKYYDSHYLAAAAQ